MAETKDRNVAFDVAKGIGILLVVLGHLMSRNNTANKVIFAFHMPLFFVLSGAFVGKYLHLDWKGFSRRLAEKIIYPYVFFSLLGLTTSWMCHSECLTSRSFALRALKLSVMGCPYLCNCSLWFLYALGLSIVTVYVVSRMAPTCWKQVLCVVGSVCVVIYGTFSFGEEPCNLRFWPFLRLPLVTLMILSGLCLRGGVNLRGGFWYWGCQ